MINILKPPPLEFLASTIQPQIILNKNIDQICRIENRYHHMPDRAFLWRKERTHDYESLAGTAVGRMERHVCDITHVDPNRRQDPARTHSSSESLVEYYPVCNARGLATTAMPYNSGQLQMDFDFIDRELPDRNE